MPILIGPVAMYQRGDVITLTFGNELDARAFFSSHVVQARPSKETVNAVALHHLNRGCCDGLDPVACNSRREKEREAREQEQARQRRITVANEYAGTEPSGFGDFALCSDAFHSNVLCRMGDRCPTCGFVA